MFYNSRDCNIKGTDLHCLCQDIPLFLLLLWTVIMVIVVPDSGISLFVCSRDCNIKGTDLHCPCQDRDLKTPNSFLIAAIMA